MNILSTNGHYIVTGLNEDRSPKFEKRTLDALLDVLYRRANRLVRDRQVYEHLRRGLKEFVYSIVDYFAHDGQLDDYVMTNILTALVTADSHGPSTHGVEDYSTFVRRLNPTDPESYDFFVIGREGRVDDSGCPLSTDQRSTGELTGIPPAQLHVFWAYFYARSRNVSRGAPRIPVDDLNQLVPAWLRSDPRIEEAFLDVCFSDGAWELYQLKLAA